MPSARLADFPLPPPGTGKPATPRYDCPATATPLSLEPSPARFSLFAAPDTARHFPAAADFRQGHTLRPATDAAMARARRRSRAPEGRTERRSRRGHHPDETAGKVRADAPRDTRRTGYSPIKKTLSALPQKGSTGVQGV